MGLLRWDAGGGPFAWSPCCSEGDFLGEESGHLLPVQLLEHGPVHLIFSSEEKEARVQLVM